MRREEISEMKDTVSRIGQEYTHTHAISGRILTASSQRLKEKAAKSCDPAVSVCPYATGTDEASARPKQTR